MSSSTPAHALYYNDELIEKLQLRWGDGFLSPGGEAELARMLQGLDIRDKVGLDFGCGVGGYDIALVRGHGARHVVGVDLGEAVIEQARARAQRAGLNETLDFMVIPPGPLPFPDGAFDFVFSKDAITDVPLADKAAVFGEFFRVCRPGGQLVVSDWFRSEQPYTEEMRRWAGEGDETYEMQTLAATGGYARDVGFGDLHLDDRNDWFRRYANEEYERLRGPLFADCVARFGEQSARTSVENARIRALLADQGQLRPGHIRARRP